MISESFGVTCFTERQYKASQHFWFVRSCPLRKTLEKIYKEIINTSGNTDSSGKCQYIIIWKNDQDTGTAQQNAQV